MSIDTEAREYLEVGKTFRFTKSQAAALDEYRGDHRSEYPTLTHIIDAALREFFQRRNVPYPSVGYRRPW